MPCCERTAITPGTPTLSSGYTQQKAAAAQRCDQARLLQTLRQGSASCCASPPSNKTAIYSSILTLERTATCQPSPVVQAKTFPKAGTTESIRLQNKVSDLITCSINPDDPYNRLNLYRKFVEQAPCPPPTAQQLNSTTPKQSFTVCQPSRFY